MALKDVEFNTHWSPLLFWFSGFPPIPLAISFRSLSDSFPQFFFKYWGSSRFLPRFSSLFTPQPFPGRVRNSSTSSTYWWHPHIYLQVGFLFLSISLILSKAHKIVSCGCSTGPNIVLWTLLPVSLLLACVPHPPLLRPHSWASYLTPFPLSHSPVTHQVLLTPFL